MGKEFEPPVEHYKPPNNEYTRMSAPEADPFVELRKKGIFLENYLTPQSAYIALNHNGMIYHLFDARRMPLGRIANRAATVLRGKHKPTYDPKKVLEIGDRVIVVNGGDILVTGKKRYQKIFRHHTNYAGGLKEILFIDLMRKDCQQLIRRTIQGMLPRNRTRPKLLERVTVHRGQYHPHGAQGLPQFVNQPLPDPNKLMGTNFMENPEDFIVVSENPDVEIKELSNISREINPETDPEFLNYLKMPRSHLKADYSIIKDKKGLMKTRRKSMKIWRRYKEFK